MAKPWRGAQAIRSVLTFFRCLGPYSVSISPVPASKQVINALSQSQQRLLFGYWHMCVCIPHSILVWQVTPGRQGVMLTHFPIVYSLVCFEVQDWVKRPMLYSITAGRETVPSSQMTSVPISTTVPSSHKACFLSLFDRIVVFGKYFTIRLLTWSRSHTAAKRVLRPTYTFVGAKQSQQTFW